jgi:hypothetical protein
MDWSQETIARAIRGSSDPTPPPVAVPTRARLSVCSFATRRSAWSLRSTDPGRPFLPFQKFYVVVACIGIETSPDSAKLKSKIINHHKSNHYWTADCRHENDFILKEKDLPTKTVTR